MVLCNLFDFWVVPDNPPRSPECFVVPSYALKSVSLPTKPTMAAIQLAHRWWRQFPQATLILSTGDNQRLGVSNAHVMAEYAVRLGIPRDHIIEEDRSRNTYENLRNSMEIIKAKGFDQPTLITLDLYARRAVATAIKLGWVDFYWVSTYSKGDPGYGLKYFQTHSRFTILCYEIAATVYSRLVGWV